MLDVPFLDPIPNRSLTVRAYNPLLAFLVAAFFALSIRFFLRLYLGRHSSSFVTFSRAVAGVIFLALGSAHAAFAWPLLVWDRPARAVGAVTAAVILLSVAIGHSKTRPSKPIRPGAVIGYLVLAAVLLTVATLTIIRTGYVALVGDRVTLLVRVMGETRTITGGTSLPGQEKPCEQSQVPRPFDGRMSDTPDIESRASNQEAQTLHRVIILLPSGAAAVDTWLQGDKFLVHGTAIRVSSFLHSLRVPYLYSLDSICTDSSGVSGQAGFLMPFPNSGELSVHPWWAPIQNWLWRYWASHAHAGSPWAIEILADRSPYYPLTNADGTPVHRDFLLVLQRWGVATSRGSSPLEHLPAPRQQLIVFPKNSR